MTRIDRLLNNLRAELKKVLTSSEFGFSDKEVHAYSGVKLDGDYITVNAEVSYRGLEKIATALDPIVQKYNKDSYFDAATTGRLEAYIGK